LDNLNTLPTWLSDSLCRLATGGGFSTRTLFTDRDQELFDAMRPTILNGIGDVITRPDLLDRALIINLPPIPKEARRLERKIYPELQEAMPGIVGFIFSAIAQGLNAVDDVHLKGLPRMADFARWGTATEEALGGSKGSFMTAYEDSQEEATMTALESWPIVSALWKFAVPYQGEEKAWVGAASELFASLNDLASDEVKRSADWPKAPNALTAQINRLSPSLREVGIHITKPTSSKKSGRKLKVFYSSPDGDRPSLPPPPSPESENTRKTQDFEGDDLGDDPGDGPKMTVPPKEKTAPHETAANGYKGDDGDDGLQGSFDEKECIHGLPNGTGCYICDPDHPPRS
jgi:hypothetical protein